MNFKPKYVNYSRRIFIGLLKNTLLPLICTILIFVFRGMDNTTFLGVLFSAMTVFSAISVFQTRMISLTEIRFFGEYFEFETKKKDVTQKTIIAAIKDTKIEMHKIIPPLTTLGANYKLIIQVKQGLTYKVVIQQYEVCNWTVDEFEKISKLFREVKYASASIANCADNKL